MKQFVKKRVLNITFSTIAYFFPVMILCATFGLLAAPVSEYIFWYALGIVVGLPLFVAYDVWRNKRETR